MRSVKGKSKAGNRKPKTERLQRKNEPTIGDNSGVTPASEQVVDILFPKTIAAAMAIERSTWTLGDALVEECGPPSEPGKRTGSDDKIEEARAALEAAGYEYSFDYLRNVRRTAANFPPGERSPDGEALPFSYFQIARTPENLQIARKKAKDAGVKLSAQFIRDTLKDQEEDEVDVANWLTSLNDELERANNVEKAFEKEKGFDRLSEQDRVKFFAACKSVERKWSEIATRFQPTSEQTDTEQEAA
jgi:hypothetical protein